MSASGPSGPLVDKYWQILLLWQQFIPENIQDMHSDIKSNFITQ